MTSIPFFLAFFAVVTVYAALRGGGPERATAAAYLIALAGSMYAGFLQVPGNFQVVPLGLFLTDAALLVALCMIAVRANRWWIIPAAGCQLVAVLVHLVRFLNPAMFPKSYEFLVDIWSWPMVLFLGLGTWAHRARLRRGTIARCWKTA